jgi:hypothetical protein
VIQFIYAADQNNLQAIVSLAGGDNLTQWLREEIADRNISGQSAVQLAATLLQDGGGLWGWK